MEISEIIRIIPEMEGCKIYMPSVTPNVVPLSLPDDIRFFYRNLGGCDLFMNKDYCIRIVNPYEFVKTNLKMVGSDENDDISDYWFVIADTFDGGYISIDLHSDRFGRCYDSSLGNHAMRGQCKIIASSFTDFLFRQLNNKGDYWYWLKPGFNSIGDAYS